MTLNTHGKQVVAVGLAYAISILERAPALTHDEPGPALKAARAHARKLVREPEEGRRA